MDKEVLDYINSQKNNFRIGVIVGNTVNGFKYKVVGDLEKSYIKVVDINTGIEHSIFKESLYRKSSDIYQEFLRLNSQ